MLHRTFVSVNECSIMPEGWNNAYTNPKSKIPNPKLTYALLSTSTWPQKLGDALTDS